MIDEEMRELVDHQRLGFVATVCPDGTPNVSPKGTLCVLDERHLVFADIRSPGTVANLRVNASIEVNVVDHFRRKGFRFKGRAVVHTEGRVFDDLVAFFEKRKLPDAPRRIRSIVVIEVTAAKPLISPVYDQGGVESEVEAHWKRHYLGKE